MRYPRIYIARPREPTATAALDDAQSRYLTRVLRLREGDHILAFSGHGDDYRATLRRDGPGWFVDLGDRQPSPAAELRLPVNLLQALVRPDKLDLVVQKTTELGVTSLTPVVTERCERKLEKSSKRSPERPSKASARMPTGLADRGNDGPGIVDPTDPRTARLQAIAVSAAEQSGRGIVPAIYAPRDLQQVLTAMTDRQQHGEARWRLILDPRAETTLALEFERTIGFGLARAEGSPAAIDLLVGPEGGFTDAEHRFATVAGFTQVSLGTPILRTETAALAALAQLAALMALARPAPGGTLSRLDDSQGGGNTDKNSADSKHEMSGDEPRGKSGAVGAQQPNDIETKG